MFFGLLSLTDKTIRKKPFTFFTEQRKVKGFSGSDYQGKWREVIRRYLAREFIPEAKYSVKRGAVVGKFFLGFGVLLIAIIFNFAETRFQTRNRNRSVSRMHKWLKISIRASTVQELTFSTNGELYALLFMSLMRSTDNGRTWTKSKSRCSSRQ